MLFDRSLVLDPSETVEIQVRGDRQAAVVIDGHSRCQLSTGAIVRCEPSAEHGRLRALPRPPLPPDAQGQVRPDRPLTGASMLIELHIENLGVIERARPPPRRGADRAHRRDGRRQDDAVEAIELLVGGRADADDRAHGRRRGTCRGPLPRRRRRRARAVTRDLPQTGVRGRTSTAARRPSATLAELGRRCWSTCTASTLTRACWRRHPARRARRVRGDRPRPAARRAGPGHRDRRRAGGAGRRREGPCQRDRPAAIPGQRTRRGGHRRRR